MMAAPEIVFSETTVIDRLESVLARLEVRVAEREAEASRLRGIEKAATEALADLDRLLSHIDSEAP
ncbi:hypothetical protein [Sandarakinorhabdus sp.]|uniref:hypothetical protein n=1 Tax=Sandarakinorhabdus sp. TaxID=1916663 RepID=UPI00286D8F45|nr:hypothetical protein [Sandarakinorhabdus sp.]